MNDDTELSRNPGVELAVRLAGSQTKLASLLGVGQSSVSSWLLGTKKIPAERAVQIEMEFDGRVSRALIRPDLW